MRTKQGSYPGHAPAKAARLKEDGPKPAGRPSSHVEIRTGSEHADAPRKSREDEHYRTARNLLKFLTIMDANQEKRIENGVAAASNDRLTILRSIHEAAENSEASREDIMIKRTIARFANLLVKLSVQADKITQENLAMQRKLVRLTWTLNFLTFVLLVVAVITVWHP